jgi:RNA polymerase sigma-70 factor, ECF subfamily
MPLHALVADPSTTEVTSEREPELQLARRAAAGERRAIAELVRRVLPRVRAVAQRMTRDAAEADDATQIALLELWQHLASFSGEGSLLGWAKVLAWRRIARHLARARRHDAQTVPLVAQEFGSASAGESLELRLDLRCILDRVPSAQRLALVLHHGHGCSLEEVGLATGAGVNTVKSRMRLALAELRAAG